MLFSRSPTSGGGEEFRCCSLGHRLPVVVKMVLFSRSPTSGGGEELGVVL